MLLLSKGEPTNHPVLSRLFEAQRINNLHGGYAISAWEIDALPADWIMALTRFADGHIEVRHARDKLRKKREQWLRDHPTYRKFRMN